MGSENTGKQAAAAMLIVLQSLFYSLGDPISKIAYDVLPVYSLLSVRYLIAFVFFMAVFGKQIIADLKRAQSAAWILPALCISISFLVSNKALSLASATSTAFLRSMTTLMTPLLGWLLYRKGLEKRHILIYALVMLGMYLLCGRGGLSGFGLGEILALVSALLSAGALIFGETAVRQIRPVTLSAVQALASCVLASVCTLVFEGGWDYSAAMGQVWAIIVYMALMCTAAGYMFQNRAMTVISARMVALLQCLYPVLTAVMSMLILGEKLTLSGAVGAFLILACVAAEIMAGE